MVLNRSLMEGDSAAAWRPAWGPSVAIFCINLPPLPLPGKVRRLSHQPAWNAGGLSGLLTSEIGAGRRWAQAIWSVASTCMTTRQGRTVSGAAHTRDMKVRLRKHSGLDACIPPPGAPPDLGSSRWWSPGRRRNCSRSVSGVSAVTPPGRSGDGSSGSGTW